MPRFTALVVVVAVGGCDQLFNIHRIDPEPRSDAVAPDALECGGHDEDADGIHDKCDGCPTLAGDNTVDTDGDGVPDLCDPSPTRAGNAIAAFYPFQSGNGWSGGGVFAMDAMQVSPSDHPVTNRAFANPVEIVVRIAGLAGANGTFQIAYGTEPRLICELDLLCTHGGTSCLAVYQDNTQVAQKDLQVAPTAINSLILWRDANEIVKCSVNDRVGAQTVAYMSATMIPAAQVGVL